MTRWSPDTCNCIVEYTDDGNATLTNVLNKCPAHSSLSDSAVYAALLDENPRKNITLSLALENGPAALFDTNLEGARILKDTISFNFSWSGTAPNRVLTISFTGITLTNQQKNSIRTFLNNRFGVGKVIIA